MSFIYQKHEHGDGSSRNCRECNKAGGGCWECNKAGGGGIAFPEEEEEETTVDCEFPDDSEADDEEVLIAIP